MVGPPPPCEPPRGVTAPDAPVRRRGQRRGRRSPRARRLPARRGRRGRSEPLGCHRRRGRGRDHRRGRAPCRRGGTHPCPAGWTQPWTHADLDVAKRGLDSAKHSVKHDLSRPGVPSLNPLIQVRVLAPEPGVSESDRAALAFPVGFSSGGSPLPLAGVGASSGITTSRGCSGPRPSSDAVRAARLYLLIM